MSRHGRGSRQEEEASGVPPGGTNGLWLDLELHDSDQPSQQTGRPMHDGTDFSNMYLDHIVLETGPPENNSEFAHIDLTSDEEVDVEVEVVLDSMPRTNSTRNARQANRTAGASRTTNAARRPASTSPPSGDSSSNKRQRVSAAGGHIERSTTARNNDKTIEEIDLVDDDLASSLQKQREEQIQLQNQQSEKDSMSGKSKLNSLQCTICLDTPTDLTATACGHLFCRGCLLDWMTSAERDTGRRPNCPACRKPLSRSRKNDMVALEIMKRPVLSNPTT